MASMSHCPVALAGTPAASDLLRSSSSGVRGIPLRALAKTRLTSGKRRDFAVSAKIRKGKKHDYPWPSDPDPNVKGGLLTHLSHFKPLKEKPKPVTLEFEKPLLDLEKKINDVRKMANETGLDFSDQITSLENKYQQALKDLYTHLTPIQRVNIARHPNRPTFLDHVFSITEKFVELHGDRAGYDDPAIVTGLGSINGQTYMFIGHQKGRNTKENIKRNFGMPTPHGYRKALRMMYYADHHGFPIVTFIDTPGAFADLKSEELGQGEAIAHNLRTMFGLKVPVISIVIGEGGSGGALAIGCANKLLMLENAVFYVASPEACAAILWKSAKAAPKAAERLKITATELCKLQIADGIIPEPLGGAHADPAWTSQQIKNAITDAMEELKKMDTEELLNHRSLKFRKIGGFQEGIPVDPARKINMKKKDKSVVRNRHMDLEGEVLKVKQQILKAKKSSGEPPMFRLNMTIEKLQKEIDHAFSKAAKSLGFERKFAALRKEYLKANSTELVDPDFKRKLDKLRVEFNRKLPKASNYESLKRKLDMLKELSKAKNLAEKNQRESKMKQEVNKKFKEVMEQKGVKEKVRALKIEIQNSGVSKLDDLDANLKEKVEKLKKEIEDEFADVIQSLGMNIEAVKSNTGFTEELDPSSDVKSKIQELNEEIQEGIKSVINSSDLKYKIELLKLETAKAGKKPDAATKKRISDMEQEIKQSIASALESSGLREKHERLRAEISEIVESSGVFDGSLENEIADEETMIVNVGANNSFA